MSFKLHRDTMLNITKAFLFFGFLLLNFAQGKNPATADVTSVYYLQHHAFVNKIHHALSYPKKSVTTNHPFLIQRNPHRTLANHLKMQMFGMPVFFKNRVKNSPAHVKYTFSRDFSVIPPKTGSLFSATGNAQEQVFAVQMLKNNDPALGDNEHIDFSVTDSTDTQNDKITLGCLEQCKLKTNQYGVAKVTITNNLGGDVTVTAKAPDGTEVKFTVTFADKYAFDPNGITKVTDKKEYLKNESVSVSVIMKTNGSLASGKTVQWTIVDSTSNGASITPTDGTTTTNGQGIATASIKNPNGGEIKVVATAPDQTTIVNKEILFSKYTTPYHVEFMPPNELNAGKEKTLQATLKDDDGKPVSGKEITWILTGDLVNIVKADGTPVTPTKTQTVTTNADGVTKIFIKINETSSSTEVFKIKLTFDSGTPDHPLVTTNEVSINIKPSQCPKFNCDLDCQLAGYAIDPATGCLMCACDG